MLSDEQLIDRLRCAFDAETDGMEPARGLLGAIERDVAARRPRGPSGARRHTFAELFTLAGALGALAILGIALALVGRHSSSARLPGTRTTDAVPPHPPAVKPLALGAVAGPTTASRDSYQGAATPRSVRLIAEAPDPAGGLPWGLRAFRTTRGTVCLQVGRVQDGTIGTIGRDSAWLNDGRFHPISPNAYTADHCTQPDGRGNAFLNVSVSAVAASADVQWGAGRQSHGCRVGNGPLEPLCPAGDLRDLSYGLLGPDATSLAFVVNGRRYTEAANRPGGAYLIVRQGSRSAVCAGSRHVGHGCYSAGGETSGATLIPGAVTAVSYRDGHICRPVSPVTRGGSCPPVGYFRRHVPAVTEAQLKTPLSVRLVPAQHYCSNGSPNTITPCQPGQTPIIGTQGQILIDISFTARRPVTNSSQYYEYALKDPPGCSEGGSSGPTLHNIKVGQQVVFQDQIPLSCKGIATGSIAYVPGPGPAGTVTGPTGDPGHDPNSLLIGDFQINVP